MIAASQIHGGIAQGIGQALLEQGGIRLGRWPISLGFIYGLHVASDR